MDPARFNQALLVIASSFFIGEILLLNSASVDFPLKPAAIAIVSNPSYDVLL
uniref:Uncharacterized protein n=1 Tax=Arundo donax TaxID=35708 RepID=A0A0A8ZXG2_ARUDO